jgi:nucleotide-binding universal stress UspA family protein
MACILVGVRRAAEARDALALAVRLARAYEVPLVLAAGYESPFGPASDTAEERLRRGAREDLDDARALVPPDVGVSTRLVGSTDPARALDRLAEHVDAGLVVLGPTHLDRTGRLVRGDVTLDVVRSTTCAVAVAPPGYARRAGNDASVGVGYVESPEGRDVLDEAIELAARLRRELRILTVVPAGGRQTGGHRLAAHDAHLAALRRAADRARERVSVTSRLLEGSAPEQLLSAADDLALLVVGSRRAGPVRRLLQGSVASRLVHAASCPLLISPRRIDVALPT